MAYTPHVNRLRVFWTFVLLDLLLLTGLRANQSLVANAPARSPLTRPIRTVAPIDLPDVRFTDAFGRIVRLSDLRGRVTLLAISNVRCVEESACVEPLPAYAAVAAALGLSATNVAYVFVGVDVNWDGPALFAYVNSSSAADVRGWMASTADLRPLTLRMGVHMNESDGVLLAHAPFIYLIDQQTRLRVYVPKQARFDELIDEVRLLLD